MTKEIHVRLPRLLKNELSGTILKEKGRLHPISLSPVLNMVPLSTATMTLAENDMDVKIHDLIELYNQHGSIGIYRVASIDKTYRGRRKIQLNHALDVLNDAIYATQNYDEESFSGTPTEYITKLLGAQAQGIGGSPYWQLGTCADTVTIQKKLRFENVLEALCDLGKEHEDYWYTFDFSTFPWTLNFVARDSSVVSEFRLNRNIASCTVSLDDSDLCTRLYLSIDTVTHVTSGQGSSAQDVGDKTEQTFATYNDLAAQALWGIVSRTAGVSFASAQEKQAKLQDWVDDYFARHNAPLVQINVDGQDLKEITGVSIDEICMGRICRVALPEYSELFQERIVSVHYPDVLRKPTYVSVSMANKRATAEDSIAAVKKEAAKAGGTSENAVRQAGNNSTEITSLYTKTGVSDLGYNETLSGRISQNAESLTTLYTKTGVSSLGQNETLSGKISQNAGDITSLYTKTGVNSLGQNETLSGKISQNAGDITSLYAKTGVNDLGQNETLSGKISQNAESLTSLFTKTGVNSLGQNETLNGKITQTAESLTSLYTKTGVNDLGQNETLSGRITQTAESLTSLYTKTGVNDLGQNETLSGKITQTAESLTSLYTKTGVDDLGQNDTLYSKISQNATAITTKVSAGDVSSTINQTAQSVLISAQKIDLQGYVTANELSAEIGSFYNASTGTLSASWVTAQGGQIGSLTVSGGLNVGVGNAASWQSTTIDGVTIHYLGRAAT